MFMFVYLPRTRTPFVNSRRCVQVVPARFLLPSLPCLRAERPRPPPLSAVAAAARGATGRRGGDDRSFFTVTFPHARERVSERVESM